LCSAAGCVQQHQQPRCRSRALPAQAKPTRLGLLCPNPRKGLARSRMLSSTSNRRRRRWASGWPDPAKATTQEMYGTTSELR
jgi:hypothetical protein